MKLKLLFIFTFCLSIYSVSAQFTIDADIRPRFEYRHGFGNLFPDDSDAAAFVVQRTRLNLGFKQEKFRSKISVQDVSVWGDTPQIALGDSNNSFSLFQAWFALDLDDNWSTKLGRQVISYDDQRIFGGLDWAMQGRFHDAALIQYKKENFIADVGFAFNQESQRNEETSFFLSGAFTYKTMQYAYLKKSWTNLNLSFLFLNSGFQKFTGEDNTIPNGVSYRQTSGFYTTFPIKKISFSSSLYYQSGKSNTSDLSAYQFSIEGNYTLNATTVGGGIEILSGTDQDGDSKNKSFAPLYGTNHKFNGFLDYFYVGNHVDNVGLNDVYIKAIFKLDNKSTLLTKAHYFSANAELSNDVNAYLGTEVDFVYTRQLLKYAKLNIGYSHMFAGDGLSALRNRSNDNTNNWGWVQIVVYPNLFISESK